MVYSNDTITRVHQCNLQNRIYEKLGHSITYLYTPLFIIPVIIKISFTFKSRNYLCSKHFSWTDRVLKVNRISLFVEIISTGFKLNEKKKTKLFIHNIYIVIY